MSWEINIIADNKIVRLDLRKLSDEEEIDRDTIVAHLKEENVAIDSVVENHIQEVLARIASGDRSTPLPVLAEGAPPENGTDGYFEWFESCDPEKRLAQLQADTEDDRLNFYGRSALIIVAQGDTLGLLHPATAGKSGRDVLGEEIPAQPGCDCTIEPGENVELAPDGQTFASLCDGQPRLEGTVLSVDPVVTVTSDVDFAIGNIEYGGDLNIQGDVKDLFEVRTGGSVVIQGTIEAARVECDGELEVKQGITGKEKGLVKVGKNLNVKYLSNVSVWVTGDATVDSEIVNVDLNVRGRVLLEKGAIHGGTVTAAGNIEAPIIGSPAGVRTVIRAAVDPFLELELAQLTEERDSLNRKIGALMPQAKALLESCRGKPNQQLKELAEELKQCRERTSSIDRACTELAQKAAENCTGTIIVQKILYPGAMLYIGSAIAIINQQMSGPLQAVVSRDASEANTLTFQAPVAVAAST